jgi:hypothetical protein
MKQQLNEQFARMQKLAGLITETIQLSEWRIDTTMLPIDDNELERFGDYDSSTNTFEVEEGSDAMADYFSDADASGKSEWMDNEQLANSLSFQWKRNLKKAVNRKYGPDAKIEFI